MNKLKVLMDVGLAFDGARFSSLFKKSLYKIVYLGSEADVNQAKQYDGANDVVFQNFDSLYTYGWNSKIPADYDIVKIIDTILNNKLTHELYDRCHGSIVFNYSTRTEANLIPIIISFYKFLVEMKPTFFVLYECPHHVRSWIMGKVAEQMGIPTYYPRNLTMPWRFNMLAGLSKETIKPLQAGVFNDQTKPFEYQVFDKMISKYHGGANQIQPEYMKVMKERKMKKLYSFSHELIHNWNHPFKLVYKHLSYLKYSKLCNSVDYSKKYVIFFLHLQPERTTLPEGYQFSSLYKAINILRDVVPNDWDVYVKEHPATFYTHCGPFGRWPNFYNQLASISGVKLIPLETDTYELIDRAQIVSTITGTVAGESLLMGRPVISFGLNTVLTDRQPLGLYNYKDMASLKEFVEHVVSKKIDDISNDYQEIARKLLLNSGISGISSKEEWENFTTSSYAIIRMKSSFRLVYTLLTTEIDKIY